MKVSAYWKSWTKNGPSVHTKMPGMKQITKGNMRLIGQRQRKGVGPLAPPVPQIIGLAAKGLGDASAQLFGLNQRRYQDRHGGDFQAAGQSAKGLNPCSACQEIGLVRAEFSRQGTIFPHRVEDTCQRGIETKSSLAERGQQFQ